jgi:pimeloyl-ACP methyl ester carboxylesterase
MPFASVNGANIDYEIAGEGEAVVFLHAGIADSRMWDAQFNHFAAQFRTLRYDLRGFGQTTAPTQAYSHIEDLRALLDQLGIQRAALIGCSNGGRVALDFLLTYPERVSALVMVCSSPRGFKYAGETPPIWDEIIAAYDSGDLERASRLETQLWAVGTNRTPDQVAPAMLDLVYEMNLIALKNEEAVGEEQFVEPLAVHRLAEIHVPTMLVIGELDSPVVLEAGKFMEEQIAGARQVFMPTAHLPSMERPDEFNHILSEFLTAPQ